MEQVINFLLACGFVPSGETKIERVEDATLGGRKRFSCGNMRATVGKRTVSFYRITGGKAHGFQNFKTKDFEGIQKFMEER